MKLLVKLAQIAITMKEAEIDLPDGKCPGCGAVFGPDWGGYLSTHALEGVGRIHEVENDYVDLAHGERTSDAGQGDDARYPTSVSCEGCGHRFASGSISVTD